MLIKWFVTIPQSASLTAPFTQGSLQTLYTSPPCVKEGGTRKRDGRIGQSKKKSAIRKAGKLFYLRRKNKKVILYI